MAYPNDGGAWGDVRLRIMTEYVFVSNIMYNSCNIKRVRWWNKLFGFSGVVVLSSVEITQANNEDGFRQAVRYFRTNGLEAQVMGMKLHIDIE